MRIHSFILTSFFLTILLTLSNTDVVLAQRKFDKLYNKGKYEEFLAMYKEMPPEIRQTPDNIYRKLIATSIIFHQTDKKNIREVMLKDFMRTYVQLANKLKYKAILEEDKIMEINEICLKLFQSVNNQDHILFLCSFVPNLISANLCKCEQLEFYLNYVAQNDKSTLYKAIIQALGWQNTPNCTKASVYAMIGSFAKKNFEQGNYLQSLQYYHALALNDKYDGIELKIKELDCYEKLEFNGIDTFIRASFYKLSDNKSLKLKLYNAVYEKINILLKSNQDTQGMKMLNFLRSYAPDIATAHVDIFNFQLKKRKYVEMYISLETFADHYSKNKNDPNWKTGLDTICVKTKKIIYVPYQLKCIQRLSYIADLSVTNNMMVECWKNLTTQVHLIKSQSDCDEFKFNGYINFGSL